MTTSARLASVVAGLCALAAGGCRASGTTPLPRPTQDDGGTTVIIDAGSTAPDAETPATMPHALLAVEPPHGPFSGGTRVLLRGNGFGSNARVWFGATELSADAIVPIDPHRIQVTAPPGDAGLADVVVQNGDDESTRVELVGGYAYDAFVAEPSTGPTSGGTLVTLHGQGTQWTDETEVTIDRNPCELVELRSPTELVCRAPAGTQGSKPMRVTTDDEVIDVLDAFAYENSDNGYRGGLSGSEPNGSVKVIAFDSVLGEAIAGAYVIGDGDAPLVARTDSNGVALLSDEHLRDRVTVTIARKCFQPVTFVDVPVDTITAYLDPVLSPTCFSPEGDLESGGGTPGQGASVTGELIWPETAEFRRDSWSNVPEPASDDEAKVAYVFPLSARPTDSFRLPSATAAVTPNDEGTTGARFNFYTRPGTYTLYALAGIEHHSATATTFTAYSMGIVRGVSVPAGGTNDDVFIEIDAPLDQALTLDVEGPAATASGPNHLSAQVAVRVGSEGYAILPSGQKSALLADQRLTFVGIPALTGTLSGTSYVAAVRADTGDSGGLPRSVLGFLSTTSTANPLTIGPFIEIPVFSEPARNGLWNGRDLAWSAAPGGLEPDLVVIDVESGGGLYDWRVVAPGGTVSTRLPDLGAVDASLAWPSGEQTLSIALATVNGFDYGNLRDRDLTERGWTAYAADAIDASY